MIARAGNLKRSNNMKCYYWIYFAAFFLIGPISANEIELYNLRLILIDVSNLEVSPNVEFTEAQKQIVRVSIYARSEKIDDFQIANNFDTLAEKARGIEKSYSGFSPFYQDTVPYLVRAIKSNNWYIIRYEFATGIRFRLFNARPLDPSNKNLYYHTNSEPVTSFDKEMLDILKKLQKDKKINNPEPHGK